MTVRAGNSSSLRLDYGRRSIQPKWMSSGKFCRIHCGDTGWCQGIIQVCNICDNKFCKTNFIFTRPALAILSLHLLLLPPCHFWCSPCMPRMAQTHQMSQQGCPKPRGQCVQSTVWPSITQVCPISCRSSQHPWTLWTPQNCSAFLTPNRASHSQDRQPSSHPSCRGA